MLPITRLCTVGLTKKLIFRSVSGFLALPGEEVFS